MSTTKYHDTQLRQEINAKLDKLEAKDQKLTPSWVTHEICKAHEVALRDAAELRRLLPKASNDDLEDHIAFWEYCGYTNTRKLATECINARRDARPSGDATQGALPLYDGFEREHLQDRYVVTRDGEDVGVPTRDLTDEEIDGKIALYESQGRAAFEHAAELHRYKEFRRPR